MDKTLNLKVWVNGKIIDQDKAVVSALSPGFQYGAGLFETIRVDHGKIFYLKEHVARLNRAWKNLFFQIPDFTDWGNVIDALIKANNLQDRLLAVKLIMSKESQNNSDKVFFAAFARQYTHRLEMLNQKGLNLITYPEARQMPLADYKTLNYLYYDRAGQFAKERGGDEAVILNSDFTISETNTASIFAIKDKTIIVPESLYVLNGVTINSILTILSDKGYGVCHKPIHKDKFYLYSNIIVSNALMGAVKVLSIDGEKIEQKPGICSMINEQLFKIDK
ncbi:aminotransferase class IV [Desulfobacterales bacterium HSG17]|nr:aminotransferase class IV [Desulfobacterales bacterium HSG17]